MIRFKDFKRCRSFISFLKEVNEEESITLSTDTRNLKSSDTFLALTGEKFNALNFLDHVAESGCSTVIYSKNSDNDKIIEKYKESLNFVATLNSEKFLQEITHCLAKDFQDNGGSLIAISGSNGKTTTKEMLFHLFRSVHPETICTQKNNNNHIGVPLTLLQITSETKYAIVELGSNHPGEIEVLCDIASARIGVTTNIGDTHLEFFHNRENVFKEEGFLFRAVQAYGVKGLYFVNNDDEFLKLNNGARNTLSFGKNGEDYKFSIENEKGIIKNNNYEYSITNNFITGEHNIFNLCVAFSIAKEIDEANTQKYLEAAKGFRPTANRSQWLNLGGKEVFLDAYNANPSSVAAAVSGFVSKVGHDSNYCLILGDMYELGEDASKYHSDLAKNLLNKGYKNFIFVGKFSPDYNAGGDGLGEVYQSTESLKKVFSKKVLDKYDYVFIKGSRSLQLESLVDIN